MPTRRRAAPLALAGVFTASGIIHFVQPHFFETIVPRVIPERHHRPLVYLSGMAELACAVGLFSRKPWAWWASAAVLAGVFPANVQMALDAGTGRHPGAMDTAPVAWGRLPLQAVMLWAAAQARPRPTDVV
jgi:uncharacterized membrane protein